MCVCVRVRVCIYVCVVSTVMLVIRQRVLPALVKTGRVCRVLMASQWKGFTTQWDMRRVERSQAVRSSIP